MPDTAMPNANTPAEPTSPGVSEIVRFWLGDALEQGWPTDPATSQRWWATDAVLDGQIRTRFANRVQQALDGELTCWEAKPLARLALVLLLDQFIRNVFRGQAQAFAGDARAQQLTIDALNRGLDADLPVAGRLFLAMPLMHAEDLALQQRGVDYFKKLAADAPPTQREAVQGSVKSAEEHRDIIVKFGRFPYRNKVLGRVGTLEETEFLRGGPRFGQ